MASKYTYVSVFLFLWAIEIYINIHIMYLLYVFVTLYTNTVPLRPHPRRCGFQRSHPHFRYVSHCLPLPSLCWRVAASVMYLCVSLAVYCVFLYQCIYCLSLYPFIHLSIYVSIQLFTPPPAYPLSCRSGLCTGDGHGLEYQRGICMGGR